MTTVRRLAARPPASRQNKGGFFSIGGDRNLALLVAALLVAVSVGPFLLVHRSPSSDDVIIAPPAAVVSRGGGGQSSGRRRKELAEARARRDGYRPMHSSDDDRLKVYIYPDINSVESEGRLLRFLDDGVESSSRFVLTDVPDGDDTVWLVDLTKAKCKDLVAHVQETLGRRMTAVRDRRHPPRAGPNDRAHFHSDILWPLYVLDFSDYGYVLDDDAYYNMDDLTTDCIRPLSDLLGKRNTYFASRQHVSGREITYDADDVVDVADLDEGNNDGATKKKKDEGDLIGDLGEVIDYGKLFCANFMSGTVRQIHYGMRSVMNDGLLKEAAAAAAGAAVGGERGGGGEEDRDLASLPRPLDVAYFWKIGDDDVRTGEHRDRVREALLELAEEASVGDGDANGDSERRGAKGGITVLADAVAEGLGSVKSENVTSVVASEMLRRKIVVVAQKDRYEDSGHRLMDALLSGSLVMTDPMHPLPVGLTDGVSVVVYDSVRDLKEKVRRYLDPSQEEERRRIGRRGREVALRYHNPAAWVERIVFGNWSSTLGV